MFKENNVVKVIGGSANSEFIGQVGIVEEITNVNGVNWAEVSFQHAYSEETGQFEFASLELVVNVEGNDDSAHDEDNPPRFEGSHPFGTYGCAEHQLFGDAWLYQDCPGAW